MTRARYPHHPKLDQLLSETWVRIVTSPDDLYRIADQAEQNRVFYKFGITHDPMYRWFDLKLCSSYNNMYVYITRDGNESGTLEKNAVDVYRGKPRCDNAIPGGGSISASSPHHFYLWGFKTLSSLQLLIDSVKHGVTLTADTSLLQILSLEDIYGMR